MMSAAGRFAQILLVAALMLPPLQCAVGQEPAPKASASDLGLRIPNATPVPGGDRRVLLRDGEAQFTESLVVGKVLVEVGDHLVVELPNGRLVSTPTSDTTPTDRPFEPATKDDLIKELASGAFGGFKTRTTKRYVYIYNSSEPFFRATSRILETMYPKLVAYCERQNLDVHEPEIPMVVIMFRTQQQFDQYRRMPDGIVAYYNGVTNHVVMYEQSELAEIAPDLAVKQSISTIAHEGVHQILHNIGVQKRLSSWPMWISEGLPEYFAPTSVDQRVRWKGVGLPNDMRMYNLAEYLKQQPADAAEGEMMRATANASALTATGYASAWALTHYLATNRKEEFFAYLRDVSKFEPLVDNNSEHEKLFMKHFGGDYNALQTGVIANLKKLPYADPIANQTHYVAVIEAGRTRWILLSTSPVSIRQWQAETIRRISANERAGARLVVQGFPNKTLAEQAVEAARN